MESVNISFKDEERSLLKSLIGQKLVAVYHDAFVFTNTSSEIVKIETDNTTAFLYSFVEPLEHFGSVEDTAVWTFETVPYPAVDSKDFVKTPVQECISKIELIEEKQRLFKGNELAYEIAVTRGIIFTLESGRQFAFEKAIWFSEEIIIHRGYNLINEISSSKEFETRDWAKDYRPQCIRTITEL